MPSNTSFIGSQLMESLDLLSEVDSLTSLLLKELLYFEVFVRIDDLPSLARAFQVCKRWSKAAKLQTFWEALTRYHFAADFKRYPNYEKPQGRDWIWVFKSKHIKSDATTFTGVGGWTYPNGDKYEGEFEDGYRHGVGVYYYKLGGMYIGNWEYGPKKGKGTFFWSHGDRYDGDWLNGDRVGQGVYIWANGNVYHGGFANNKQHQYGEFKEPNGWKICAQWNDGIPILANIDIGTETDLSLLGKEEDQQPQHQSHQHQQQQQHQHQSYEQQKEMTQKWHENPEYCAAFNPIVQEAIRRGVCTYALTGTKMFGQVLWETQELDTRRHGVCIVCRDKCVPKNGLKVQPKPAFGGNFFCDCGYNFHKGVTCFSLVKD